jgi:cytochrome P450
LLGNATGIDGAPLPPKIMAAHLAGLALGAYETQTSVLSWILFLLAQHPTIAIKLLDEVQRSEPVSFPDAKAYRAAPLIENVILETMRLVTPVPMLCLQAREDMEVFGIPVRRKSFVVLSPHNTHREPEIYEAPDRFMPDRWQTIRPSSYEFLAFSAGARRCPGFWYATNNLRIMLSEIMQRFRFTLEPGVRIDRRYEATTIPKYGMPLRLSPQDGQFARQSINGDIVKFIDFGDEADQ